MKFFSLALLVVAAQAIMLTPEEKADQQGPPPMHDGEHSEGPPPMHDGEHSDGEHSDHGPSREDIMAMLMSVDGEDGDGEIDIHEAKMAAEALGAPAEDMDEILAPFASGRKITFDDLDAMLHEEEKAERKQDKKDGKKAGKKADKKAAKEDAKKKAAKKEAKRPAKKAAKKDAKTE